MGWPKWGLQQPYANFKTAYFVIYLSSFMTDFHENSITGNSFDEMIKMGITLLILMDFHKIIDNETT